VENWLPKGMLGTPQRTVVVGVAALVVATILLLAYLSHYRSSVKSENATVQVLQAKDFIRHGTSAESLARDGSFQLTAVPKDQLKDGAIDDAAELHGQVALNDIYTDQQLTVGDFGVTPLSSALSASADLLGTGAKTGTWRAIAIAPDGTHGIAPQAQTGDHVDVYLQLEGTLRLLMDDVLILAAPGEVATGTAAPTSENYILRVPTKDAARFAFAAQNGDIWFLLRPQQKAKPAGAAPVTSSNVFGR
jgi:Flp pilus assembly protein CpaB